VVVVTIEHTVLMVYLVKILRNVRKITDAINEEAILLRRDIGDLRNEIRARGARAAGAFDWFERFFGNAPKSRSKKRTK
jgi:hypothetical protein